MDSARTWQVVSVAGAVTSIALGGVLLARPSRVPAEPIVLKIVQTTTSDTPAPATSTLPVDPAPGPIMVPPQVVEIGPDDGFPAPSIASTDDDDDDDDGGSVPAPAPPAPPVDDDDDDDDEPTAPQPDDDAAADEADDDGDD